MRDKGQEECGQVSSGHVTQLKIYKKNCFHIFSFPLPRNLRFGGVKDRGGRKRKEGREEGGEEVEEEGRKKGEGGEEEGRKEENY